MDADDIMDMVSSILAQQSDSDDIDVDELLDRLAATLAQKQQGEVMEAVQLQKVAVTHGDDGAQKKSPGLQNSGQAGMDSKPVRFAGHAEAVPSSPKGPSNAYAKGETKVKGAGSFKNAPGHKSQDLSSAPKPVTKDGAAHGKSPVAK
jgi:hypothetical protein